MDLISNNMFSTRKKIDKFSFTEQKNIKDFRKFLIIFLVMIIIFELNIESALTAYDFGIEIKVE